MGGNPRLCSGVHGDVLPPEVRRAVRGWLSITLGGGRIKLFQEILGRTGWGYPRARSGLIGKGLAGFAG